MIEVDEDDVNEMVHDEFDADAFMIDFDVDDAHDVCDEHENFHMIEI